jgi:hypothetical protein
MIMWSRTGLTAYTMMWRIRMRGGGGEERKDGDEEKQGRGDIWTWLSPMKLFPCEVIKVGIRLMLLLQVNETNICGAKLLWSHMKNHIL